jgi:hypothetical protein
MKRLRVLLVLCSCLMGWFGGSYAQPPSTGDCIVDGLEEAMQLLVSGTECRKEAIDWLNGHPEDSHGPLIALLRADTSQWMRTKVLWALLNIATIEDLPLLDSLVKSPLCRGLWGLYDAIAMIPSPPAFDSLMAYAAKDSILLIFMGSSKDPRARPYLERLLGSEREYERRNALYALNNMGAGESRAVLEAQLLVEQDLSLCRDLHRAISKLPPAAPPADMRNGDWERLRASLAGLRGQGEERQNAIEWLGKHPTLCHDSLMVLLKTGSDEGQMLGALKALHPMVTMEDLPVLDKLLKGANYQFDYPEGILYVIAAIQDPVAFDSVVSYCVNVNLYCEKEAIQAIGYSKDPRARAFLEMMLRSASGFQRDAAILAFRTLGVKGSREALKAQLKVETDAGLAERIRVTLKEG